MPNSINTKSKRTKYFGYDYAHDTLKGLRDLFLNAATLHAYRLNGGGKKAANTYATAKYSGIRGNDLMITIAANVDAPEQFDVSTYLNGTLLEMQTAAKMADLIDNDYVTWNAAAELRETAGEPPTGGANGEVTGGSYQKYIDAIEKYTFHAMGVVSVENSCTDGAQRMARSMLNQLKFCAGIIKAAINHEEPDGGETPKLDSDS